MKQEEVDKITRAMVKIAYAISSDAAPGQDAAGGIVDCLTASMMGVTAGLCQIADSIENLAEAVREHSS